MSDSLSTGKPRARAALATRSGLAALAASILLGWCACTGSEATTKQVQGVPAASTVPPAPKVAAAKQRCTLSEGSQKLLARLAYPLSVKLFIREGLTPSLNRPAQVASNLLAEYQACAHGNLQLKVTSLGKSDQVSEEDAPKYHIEKSDLLSIGFDYNDKVQGLHVGEQVESLEFEISRVIWQLTVKRRVAFASSEGEPPLGYNGLQIFSEQLKKEGYETVARELKMAIPADIDVLLIVGPKQPMSELGKYVVDQFLMRGKGVAFLVDGQTLHTVQVPRAELAPGMEPPQLAQANSVGVEELLGTYGLKIKQDLILDTQNYIGPVRIAGQKLGIQHPVFLSAGPLPQNHEINQQQKAVVLPFVSSLELVGEAKEGKGNVLYTRLIETSKESWRASGPFVFLPTQRTADLQPSKERGPFTVGYAASGKFKSAFAGKPGANKDGRKYANAPELGLEPLRRESPDSARLVVIGDSDFICDEYVGLGLRNRLEPYIGNLAYALNIVDWLAQSAELAQVPRRAPSSAQPF